ncbi:MAG: hypothetical protein Q7S87_05165 [Agitococcus sp.]|nr:hypothetical protein [Agitococcus sp.]MDO9179179.1 hypothetical protein [Agitococcus sp.]
MLKISILCGIVSALLFLALTFLPFQQSLTSATTELRFGVTLLGYTGLMVVTGYLAQLLILAFSLYLVRGPGSVGWTRPSQCLSISKWLMFSWGHYSSKGLQVGFRVIGFEFALKGNLHSV